MAGFLLRGEVFLQRTNNKGVAKGGLFGPINAEQLTIEPDMEEIIRPSKNKATYGKSLGKVQSANPTKISMKFDEVDAALLADSLGAEIGVLNQQAASVSGEPYDLRADGTWTSLGAKHITSTNWKVMKATTELVDGVDYEVNWSAGLIRPVKGGAIESGGVVNIDFQALALAGNRLKGGQVQEVNWAITMTGENVDTGDPIHLEIPLAQLSSSGALNLVQNEYLSPEFEGVASIAAGKDYDYLLDVITPE